MSNFELHSEKSTLRFLTNCLKLVDTVATEEFGRGMAAEIKVILSRKLYFTLGNCWPERKQVSYNLAWLVMNKSQPKVVRDLLIHELMHLVDRTHGVKFQEVCAKYGVIGGGETKDFLPPASWAICIHCGDTQGLIFRNRLSPEQIAKKLTNLCCRSCGKELEYRQLSDKAFKNLSGRIRKLRLYGTETWKVLKGITDQSN